MIFYACIWFVLGIGIATITVASKWFWILQGIILLGARRFLMITMLILAGMNYYHVRHHLLTQWHLPTSWIKRPLTITATIISLPKVTTHVQQFIVRQDKSQHTFRLSWYDAKQKVHYGDHWRFRVSLKPPLGLYNPGGFDYGRWLLLQGIQATGYIKSPHTAQLLSRAHTHAITRWREALQQRIQQDIANPDIAGLIAALTVGSHHLIQPDQWTVFQRTGTNHLMAISGLHIGFVAGFGFLLMGFLWRRSRRLMLWQPVQYAQAVAAIIAAIIYGMMAGFSLPTQRAVWMVIVVMLATLSKQPIALWMRLVFAFCMVVIVDPFVLYSSSLWMSFGSVVWIAFVCSGRLSAYNKWWAWWRLQVALLVGLAPLTLFYFHQVSIIGFLANAVAVPWVGFVIVPLCLMAAVMSVVSNHWSQLLFMIAGKCISPLWHYLQWLAQQQWAVWLHVIPALWILVFALIGAFLLLLPRGLPGRWLGIFLWLPLFFYKPAGPLKGQVWITTLDVGQGLSTVVRTWHHVLLYDAGPKSYSGFDAGAQVVVPYLQYMGITHLDMLMISHGDNDHIGGAAAVLNAIATQKIMTSVPWNFKRPASACYRGQQWRWDGVTFHVLWPLKGQPYADNNSSCIVRISDGSQHILLTGDIEAPVEQWLVKHEPTLLPADMIIAPHHGSRTSSTAAFVALVHPRVVIFPTGAYNRYHFPSVKVVARYRKLSAKLYNSAFDGAITVQINHKKIESIKTARAIRGKVV